METIAPPYSLMLQLVCSRCGRTYDPQNINTYATCCEVPLVSEYDLASPLSRETVKGRPENMWRYREMLPVLDPANIVSLNEGWTPVFQLSRISERFGMTILIKDEGQNPTGSFKARGISAAVSKAKELGIDRLIIPTAGNAGGALAAYCAQAGMECVVVMPEHSPEIFKLECKLFGAEVIFVNGLINDCATKVGEIRRKKDYFDISTLKEPYRLEGKKTMGYEIAEQLGWQLPDVIVYPTGGGTGLIGIWKAFQEMLSLGWIEGPLPRMIAVEAANCAPLQRAMANPAGWKADFVPLPSLANGLAVPYPFAMDLMRQVILDSGGLVLTVDEKELISGIKEIASQEGMLLSPEGSATWVAFKQLYQDGFIGKHDRALLLNTGSGYKYLESIRDQLSH